MHLRKLLQPLNRQRNRLGWQMMSDSTGYPVGVGSLGETLIGEAYERASQASEFGLPEGYVDPTDYRGKTPPCDADIGVMRSR